MGRCGMTLPNDPTEINKEEMACIKWRHAQAGQSAGLESTEEEVLQPRRARISPATCMVAAAILNTGHAGLRLSAG